MCYNCTSGKVTSIIWLCSLSSGNELYAVDFSDLEEVNDQEYA